MSIILHLPRVEVNYAVYIGEVKNLLFSTGRDFTGQILAGKLSGLYSARALR